MLNTLSKKINTQTAKSAFTGNGDKVSLFDSAKVKLFKMIKEGIDSKNEFIVDSDFWKEFKKI